MGKLQICTSESNFQLYPRSVLKFQKYPSRILFSFSITSVSGLFIMDNEEEETSRSQSRNQLPFTPPQELSRPRYLIPRPTSTLRTPTWTLTDVAQAPAEQDNSSSQQPFPPPSQEPVQTLLPPVEFGARFASVPPEEVLEISDDNIIDEYIESRLRQMNKSVLDDDYETILQQIILDLISRARLTTEVFIRL